VTGALASRNSFVGFSTPFGAVKLGKNDTPYKSVTADFDFLADAPGDYNSIWAIPAATTAPSSMHACRTPSGTSPRT